MRVAGHRVERYWAKGEGWEWRQCSIRWTIAGIEHVAVGAMRGDQMAWQIQTIQQANRAMVLAELQRDALLGGLSPLDGR